MSFTPWPTYYKCPDCDVVWADVKAAGSDCWICDEPGVKTFIPSMRGSATWLASSTDSGEQAA